MNSNFEDLAITSKRIRVILEQNECCNKCKLNTWLELPIVLELDHIDGNRENNIRENLEALCPNCHAQTPTWRGKKQNIGKRQKYFNRMLNNHKTNTK